MQTSLALQVKKGDRDALRGRNTMNEISHILRREFIYLWYYFELQLRQIFWYWVLGIAIGSFISVFARDGIHDLFRRMQGKKWGIFGIVPACLLGIASPLCMYGTIPIAASFSRQGMRHDWLASFMMASILLNPQLIVYSAALGPEVLTVRIVSCFLCGCAAGLLIHIFYAISGQRGRISSSVFCSPPFFSATCRRSIWSRSSAGMRPGAF